MIIRAREGLREFDCEPDHQNRRPGLSAMVRLHNEEVWIGACLESIAGWCDEIVVVLNLCTDRTPEIVERFRAAHPDKVRVFDYPFRIWPMGPGHDLCPPNSVEASAHYYNFAQAKTTRAHVVKWDGDMVAMGWLGAAVGDLLDAGRDRIRFEGVDIVGDELRHTGSHPRCRTNGVYRVATGVHYAQGAVTQNLQNVPDVDDAFDGRPMFVHLKWCRKSFESATAQWPENWREIDHFTRIAERRHPVAEYRGEYPAAIAALLDEAAA